MRYFTKEWYARMQYAGRCGSQEEWERLRPEIQAPVDAYRTYVQQNSLSPIDDKLHFHDWRVLHARRVGGDFCLFLGWGSDPASALLRCVGAQQIGQELAPKHAAVYCWLYHEIYLTATGYRLLMLLSADGALYEWSVDCARMELTHIEE